ncbi:AraC-like DNA-binding protein [Flavobacterium araucananum]|uniref:AraC family transcriptional regulator n=1 Tax=Flavobacterium araucananum TaxID=946678 RepID=A0A227P7U2_9FLAO|nr:helix-turn-helix domain-containing protein [Flavobacterium araucananum]OXG05085.1 AraC family transcriptional regulator [Flavobacterium araucananum]PWJ96800.1 AraC-like DNA-binding protein [Flavobacterium araucananum]
MTSNIEKYEFKSGLAQEFEIIGMAELYREFVDTLTAPHRTNFYHILWFQKGSPTHIIDFNPVKVKPNSVLFLNKDAVQKFDKNGDFDGKVLLFTDSFFCKTPLDSKSLQSNLLFNNLLSVSQIELKEISSDFNDLFELLETEFKKEKDNYQSDILRNYLHNLLLLSEREIKKQNFTQIKKGADFDYMVLFKDLLETAFRTQKQVSSYAKQLLITEKRLNQATTKILGKTPKEIIDDRVMLEAKRLLAHTNENVKEISYELGFEEPTNFIKYFRKHSNNTPVEFRESHTSA